MLIDSQREVDSNAKRNNRWLELFSCTVVVPALLLAVLWIPMREVGLGASADFVQFYAAGKIVVSGQGARLYDANLQSDIERQVAQHVEPILFNHPPFEALVYAPLAHFGFSTAFAIWTFLNLSLLGAAFFLLRVYGPPFGLAERLLLLAVAFYPVLATMIQGQDSLWILLAYVAAFLALKRGHDFSSGMFLGIAFIKPQLVVPFALLMLLRGRWRFFLGLVLAAAILAAVSILVVGPSVALQYPPMLLHMNDQAHAATFHLFPESMPNLRGLFTLVFGASLTPFVLSALLALASLAVLILAWRSVVRWSSFDLSFSLMLVTTLLVSFHLLLHDLSLLILPVFLFLNFLHIHRTSWATSKILRVTPFVLLFLTILIVQSLHQRNFSLAAVAVAGFALAIVATASESPAKV